MLAKPQPLCLMTYNLKFASDKPPHPWSDRRPLMADLIQTYAPDLIGTQEGLYPQLKDILADSPSYDWIGLGRNGGSRGEFMALLYRTERLEPLAFDHFWLSDTPDVIASASWGNSCRRMVTWARFADRLSGREFYYVNTHFDNQSHEAKVKGAHLVIERVKELQANVPVFLGGDFNALAEDSKVYDILTAFFTDTWPTAKVREGEHLSTYNRDFAPGPFSERGHRIDWILARGDVHVHKTAVLDFAQDGHCPSDHFPVVAWVSLP